MRRAISTTVAAAITFLACAAPVAAFPTKPLTIVVPLQSGGAVDAITRIVAKPLSEILGQPVIVENRPGASNMIGTNHVAKSAPDGHTLLTMSTSAVIQEAFPTQPGNARLADFSAVGLIGYQPMLLEVNPSVPHKTLPEFLDYARKNPGKLNYGTFGNGTTTHLVCEMAAHALDIKMTPIPYRGAPAAVTDLLGGEIQVFCDVPATAAPLIKQGSVKAIGVMSDKRSHTLPNVPTFAELGYPDVQAQVIYGLLAPSGTPPETLTILNSALNEALKRPEVMKGISDLGAVADGGHSAEEFSQRLQAELKKWQDVVKQANIRLAE